MEGCGPELSDQQLTHWMIKKSKGTSSNEPVSESDLDGLSSLYASYPSFNTLLKNVVYVTLTL